MSNLGAYQMMTTLAKKVGGPIMLAAMTAVGGWVLGRSAEAGGKQAFEALKKRSMPCATPNQVFRVHSDGGDGPVPELRTGDEFRVLECDGDAILIEVLGGSDNPHFVSGAVLATISDFPAEKQENDD